MTARKLLCTLLAGAAAMLSHQAMAAGPCPIPRDAAPGTFKNSPLQWGNDSGVIVPGFIDLKDPASAGLIQVIHGVDLSHYNDVDYDALKSCGAQFAFVQVDDKYNTHAAGLGNHGMRSIPYKYFGVTKPLKMSSVYRNIQPAAFAEHLKGFAAMGTESGNAFVAQIDSANGPKLTSLNLANISGTVVALDVEEKLIDEPSSTADDRLAYGRLYARAVCSWIATVKSKHPELTVFLYTTPYLYWDYLDKALEEDQKCLNGLPVWLAATATQGDDLHVPMATQSSAKIGQNGLVIQRVCRASGGNRCIAHQYTHRGVFAAKGPTINQVPPHIDLNRLFYVTIVPNAVGSQMVRR